MRITVTNSPATKNTMLKNIWVAYSGMIRGFRVLHCSIGFLKSVFNSSNAIIWNQIRSRWRIDIHLVMLIINHQQKNFIDLGKNREWLSRLTWKTPRKMRKASKIKATIYENAAKVKPIVLIMTVKQSCPKYSSNLSSNSLNWR